MTSRRTRYATALCALLTTGALVAGCSSDGGTSNGKPDGKNSPSAKHLFDGRMVAVGVKKGQPGLSQKPKDGYRFEGFEQKLLSYLEGELDFRSRAVDISSSEREELLEEEVVKLIIASYSIDPERAKHVLFTAPYLRTPQGVLVRHGDTSIKHQGDLADKDLCTSAGSVADPQTVEDGKARKKLEERIGAHSIGLEQDYKTCVKQLLNEKYDGVVTDTVILHGFEEHLRKTAPPEQRVDVVDGLDLRGPPQLYGVGLPRGYEQECRRINGALENLLYNGAKWNEMFEDAFPDLANEDTTYETSYKPEKAEFLRRAENSCGSSGTE